MARKTGSKNVLGASAKENVVAVFTRLGGTHAMAEWAKDNLTDFYRLYAKLIPQEVSGAFTVDHTVETGDAVSLSPRLDKLRSLRQGNTVQ